MEPQEEGELVETGTFRVDRSRMLDVLSAYQLTDPGRFKEAWVRCAVASGAKKISLVPLRDLPGWGFDFIFDGRPFTPQELLDIYAPLLEGGQSRGSHFAIGLLTLLRGGLGGAPASVTIYSKDASLVITSLTDQRRIPGNGADVVQVRVLWDKEPENSRHLTGPIHARLCPVPVEPLDGACFTWPNQPRHAHYVFFDGDGRRGFACPVRPELGVNPAERRSRDSRLSVYTYGCHVESVPVNAFAAHTEVYVNDDALTLDASLAKCVKDEKFAALLAFAAKKAEELLLSEIAAQREDLAKLGEMARVPAMAAKLRGSSDTRNPFAGGVIWNLYVPEFIRRYFTPEDRGAGDTEFFAQCRRRTVWLRDACLGSLLGLNAAPADPQLKALWDAPVLLSGLGRPLSLAGVHALINTAGRLPVSRLLECEAPHGRETVWLASDTEAAFLREWLPESVWHELR